MLIRFYSFAQKIKIDKGEIKLDEKTIGFVEGKKSLFTILSLDKTYVVTAGIITGANKSKVLVKALEDESFFKKIFKIVE